MKLAVAVSGTKSYLHAWTQCVRSIATAAAHIEDGHFIFATDHSEESKEAELVAKAELPSGWQVHVIRLSGMEDDAKDYEKNAQLRIAALQGASFHFARTKIRPDYFWSVESDNIVPANSLRVLKWALEMPREDGSPLYDIAAGTYQNGLFLGGRGSYQHPIAEDFTEDERKLKPRLKKCIDACRERLVIPSEKESKRLERLQKRVRNSPPDGNVWEITARHGWKPRGWMDFAYPGIGEGAIVPSDWCGLGCTMMTKKALQLADFAGYDGRGTQDLFLCWKRWHPAGLRIACVPHVAADHVKKAADGTITHHVAFHEPEGPYKGHMRGNAQPFVPV